MNGFQISFCSLLAMLCLPSVVQAQRAEAYIGDPFGVARITVDGPSSAESVPAITNAYQVTEANGRSLYPVFVSGGRLGGALREALGDDVSARPGPVTVMFLYRGNEPLDVTVSAPRPTRVRIVPQRRPRFQFRLLRTWWRNYSAAAERQIRQGDYPPLIETYLTTVLGRRLNLPTPLLSRLSDVARKGNGNDNSLSLLLNTESLRLETLERSLSGDHRDTDAAHQPVPETITWQPGPYPEQLNDVPVESIAAHVPEECFYIRFGNFDNYLWLRELMEEYGGDIGRMVTARGHDAGLNQRMQDQLGLKETALAKILGNKVISDVAILGRDTYLQEGAAIGIMFEARNGLLGNDLMKQRREAVTRMRSAGAEMTTVDVDGHEVSLAATVDNRLRSFYAVDGKYHLVTTSIEMVRRFYETGQGVRPLDQSPSFRLARSELPLERDDTIFVFMSPEFFQGLLSPQYQVELRRRMRAVNDLEMLQMARWVARLENRGESIDELVAAGLVPTSVQQRADGSQPVEAGGRILDSLRGGRGTFLPIPDVVFDGVTPRELATYQNVVEFHTTQWTRMDPVIVALKRFSLPDENRERLRIEARMLPFDRKKYGRFTSVFAAPSRMQLRPAAEDMVSVQAVVQGGTFQPEVKPHLLFFGLQDAAMPVDFGRSSFMRTLNILRKAPAYLGAWPKLGLLDLLPIGTAPDGAGFSRLPLGLWRRQSQDGFSLVSFDPHVLETTLWQLAIEKSDHLAQARIRVGDVSASKLRPWLESLNYQRSYQSSIANARLLHAVSQQLGVPRDQAKEVAESILGVSLMCALGGEYKLARTRDGLQLWVSNRWPSQQGADKTDDNEFSSPLMQWFRGLEADVIMLQDRVIAYAAVDMQRPEKNGGNGEFPLFNLFRDNPFKKPGNEQLDSGLPDPLEELPPPEPVPAAEPLPPAR